MCVTTVFRINSMRKLKTQRFWNIFAKYKTQKRQNAY